MLLMRAWFTATVLAAFAGWYVWSWLTVPPAVPAKKKVRSSSQPALDAAQRVIDELEPREATPAYVGFRGAVRRLQKRGSEQWERDIAEILERTDGDRL